MLRDFGTSVSVTRMISTEAALDVLARDYCDRRTRERVLSFPTDLSIEAPESLCWEDALRFWLIVEPNELIETAMRYAKIYGANRP